MAEITLTAHPRELTGKKVGRLRRAGLLPAVIYGPAAPQPRSIQVDQREFESVYQQAGTTQLVDVIFANDNSRSRLLIRDVQYNMLKRRIVHADFYAVNLLVETTLAVPLTLVGEAPIAHSGEGVLSQTQNVVHVSGLPDRMPTHIEVDLSGVATLDTTIRAGDLALPEGLTLADSPDVVLVSVTRPEQPEEEEEITEAAEEAVAAEPTAEAETETGQADES